MRKLKFVLDQKALQIIHYTFIRPILEYSDVVWDNCTQNKKNELNKIQLEVAWTVTVTTKLVSSLSLYRELGWECPASRRRKHKLILFYKMINRLGPDHLDSWYPLKLVVLLLKTFETLRIILQSAPILSYIMIHTCLQWLENEIACNIRAEMRPHLNLSKCPLILILSTNHLIIILVKG